MRGRQRQHAVLAGQRRGQLAPAVLQQAEPVPGGRVLRLQRHHALERSLRLVEAAQTFQRVATPEGGAPAIGIEI